MPIPKGRVDSSHISTITKSNMSKASDAEAINQARSISDINSDKPNTSSMFSRNRILPSDSVAGKLGIFGDILCGNITPLNLRLPKFKLGNLRDLNFRTNLNLCGENFKSPLDNVLSRDNSMSLYRLVVPPSKEREITHILNNELRTATSTITNLKRTPDCILDNAKGKLASATNPLGRSLRDRASLMNIFNNRLDPCSDTALMDRILPPTLGIVAASSSIDNLAKLDTNKAVKVANEQATNSDNRENLLNGYNVSLSNKADPDVENKLYMLHNVKNTNTDQETKDREAISTRGTTDNVLVAVGNSNKISANPVNDYNNLTMSLDSLDPNWAPMTNEGVDASSAKNNPRLAELSRAMLTSKPSSNPYLTGVVTTNIALAEAITLNNLKTA